METVKKPLILIVDDTPLNLQMLGNILYNKGYSISTSSSGAHALQSVNRNQPDLILLDIQMPGMDGFEVCKILKSDAATKDIPVIFLSAMTEIEKVVSGFELGAVDYITKPFNINELLARIATHIELKFAREKLVELNATKDMFFSIISHDLRNPLSAILLSSELLQIYIEKKDNEKSLKFARNIQVSALSVNKLLENLIGWSQVQTGKLLPKIENHNLKPIVNEVSLLFNEIAINKSITLINNIISDVYVDCDLEMTKTILRNLVSNALKFTDREGIVSISCVENEIEIEVHISDNGVGIDPQNIKYLFAIDKNISTPGTLNEKGTGLGLLFCKELVEKQGGRIWAESETGKGSVFTFTIPLVKE